MGTDSVNEASAQIALGRRIAVGAVAGLGTAVSVGCVALAERFMLERVLFPVDAAPLGFICALGAFAGFVCGALGAAPTVKVPVVRRILIGLKCGARLTACWIGFGVVVGVAIICVAVLVGAAGTTLLHGADAVLRVLARVPPPAGLVWPLLWLWGTGTFVGGGLGALYSPLMGRYGLATVGAFLVAYGSSRSVLQASLPLPPVANVSFVLFLTALGCVIGNRITRLMLISGQAR